MTCFEIGSTSSVSGNTAASGSAGAEKAEKTSKASIFEDDGNEVVDRSDFKKDEYADVAEKHNYIGLLWKSVENIIVSLCSNIGQKAFGGNINVMGDDFQNARNQLLVSDISLATDYNEVLASLGEKGITLQPSVKIPKAGPDGSLSPDDLKKLKDIIKSGGEKNDSYVTESGLTVIINRQEYSVKTTIKNQDGEVLQEITTSEIMRGGGRVNIKNYNEQGKIVSELEYNNETSLNAMETYTYDDEGNASKTRYLYSDRSKIVSISNAEGGYTEYNKKGKEVK